MDFDWFYYVATVVLNMAEETFWRSTPRKINALQKIHGKYNGWKDEEGNEIYENEEALCIDQVPFL